MRVGAVSQVGAGHVAERVLAEALGLGRNDGELRQGAVPRPGHALRYRRGNPFDQDVSAVASRLV